MTRILLLGKDGQLGWELRRSLAGLGEVSALGARELDLARADDLRETLRQLRPDVVVNAAAYTAVDRAEAESSRAVAVNGVAPGVLAEEARMLGAALIHYSTDYVFDGEKREPYSEDDPPNPLGVYGSSKLAGERAVQQVGGAYLILRTSWVYSLRRESFVTKVLQWARSRRTLHVVEDQVGSPTWCRSLAGWTAEILAHGADDLPAFLTERAGLYHIAGRGAVSRFQWAREILRMDPRREEHVVEELLPARTERFPAPAARPPYSALDSSRAESVFGVRPEPWRDALARAMQEAPEGAGAMQGSAAGAGATAAPTSPREPAAPAR